MAEEHTTADDHAPAGAEAPEAERVEMMEEAAEGIAELQDRALDPAELSRQLEDLTSVVLNSAEVSTRSASVAADVSADMQAVMDSISESQKRSIHHSKVILGALLLFIIIAVGTFFAIATRMQQNIRQLDALALAVGKRVVELDTTVGAFTESAQSLFELAEKMEAVSSLPGKMDQRFEEFNKSVQAVPGQVTSQVAAQTDKSLDAKLQNLQKQLQALESKVQAVATRPQPQIKDNSQAVVNELQKLQKEVNGMQARAAARAVEPPKPAEASKPKAEVKLEPKPEPKPAVAEAKPASPQVPANRDRVLMYPRPNPTE
jgi:hypothetical protein